MSSPPHVHVVLVGGGHAMLPTLESAGRWIRSGVAVTLISSHRYLYYSGMTPEYLGGVYGREAVRIDLRARCARSGVRFVEDTVEAIRQSGRVLVTSRDERFQYDLAAFDVGGVTPGSLEGVRTRPLHCIEDLATHVRQVLSTSGARLDLLVVGGGAAGVEIALNLTARWLARGRRRDLGLTIVEESDRLLPDMPRALSAHVTRMLSDRGVRIVCGARVRHVDDHELALSDGTALRPGKVLLATGTTGPALFAESGLACDPDGFIRVSRSLQSVTDSRLFAAGDCCSIDGLALAKVGVHAVKQGKTLRANLHRAVERLRERRDVGRAGFSRFRPYPVAPLILSTGTRSGLFVADSLWLSGSLFLLLKHFLDRRWMKTHGASAWRAPSLPDLVDSAAPLA